MTVEDIKKRHIGIRLYSPQEFEAEWYKLLEEIDFLLAEVESRAKSLNEAELKVSILEDEIQYPRD